MALKKIDSARFGSGNHGRWTPQKNMTYGIYDLEKFPVSSYKCAPASDK